MAFEATVKETKAMAERLVTKAVTADEALFRILQGSELWAKLALLRLLDEELQEVSESTSMYAEFISELRGTTFRTANINITDDNELDIIVSCTIRANADSGAYKLYVYNSDSLDIKSYDSYDSWCETDGYATLSKVFRTVPEVVGGMLSYHKRG